MTSHITTEDSTMPEYTGTAARAAAGTAADGDRQVSGWHEIYQELYRDADAADFGENFAGWESSYDGAPIPLEQMRHWRDDTVRSIRALRPRRVLEIGVGSGLLMSQLLDDCEEYWGADMSEAVIGALRAQLAARPAATARKVRLQAAPAHLLDELPAGHFDTVVINSVIQYFPHVDYLTEVLTKAVLLLAPGGSVFVGDVRDLELLPRFHTAVALGRDAGAARDTAALREAVARTAAGEKELALAPSYFAALPELLPELEGVDVRLKASPFHNELTRHRYDVVLRTAAPGLDLADAPRLDWSAEGLDPAALRTRLAGATGPLRIAGVPNVRLAGEDACRTALAEDRPAEEVRAALTAAFPAAVEPDALRELAEQAGHRAAITLCGADHTRFDLVLWPAAGDPGEPAVTGVYLDRETAASGAAPSFDDPGRYANSPAALEAGAAAPAAPVRPAAGATGEPAAPRDPYEDTVRALFAEVLAVPRHTVGCDQDFFAIGGHSLASARLVGRIRAVLGVALGMRSVYEARTVAALAALVRRQSPRPPAGRAAATVRPDLGCAGADGWSEAPLAIGAAAHRGLTALAREHGATSGMALHAAVTALLARMSGADAVPVALASGGLPAVTVTAAVDGRPGFTTLLERVRAASVAAWAAGDRAAEGPSATLVLDPADGGRGAAVAAAADGPVLELTERWSQTGAPAGVEGRVRIPAAGGARDGSGGGAVAELFGARLERLLDAVVADPGHRIDTLGLDLPGEAGDHPGSGAEHTVPQTPLPAMLGMQALLTPHAPAVVTPDSCLTHAGLEERAGLLARRLLALGAGPGRLVAVRLPAGQDLVVAYAAVAKSGAACLPLPPGRAVPPVGVPPVAVVTSDAVTPWPGIPAVPAGPDGAEPAVAPLPVARAGDPVLATATPGGLVLLDAGPLRALGAWRFATMPAEAGAPRAVIPDPDTDFGFLDIADALACGATVHLAGPGADTPGEPARWPAGTGAAELSGPARAVARTARAARDAGAALAAPSVLAVTRSDSGWHPSGSHPGHDTSGTGESPWAHDPDREGSGPAGPPVVLEHRWTHGVRLTTVRTAAGAAPLWNQAVRVLDPALRPVPPGLVGTLYLAGSALGGTRPERAGDAARWVADPYGAPGALMLRTGIAVRAAGPQTPDAVEAAAVHDPFEDTGALYLVLDGPDGRRSLWPAEVPVPAGWAAAGPEDVRDGALEELARSLTMPLTAPVEPSATEPVPATRSSR
ncbi:phosphopantetheine-binding protein [Streptomyces racemochromogenes]|uniref:Phosphopantetheine-binding protein n=1 Tax=Streptomyces racemochromogenes TaxID=67353 RepID=A0ABW7PFT6_9ACTN